MKRYSHKSEIFTSYLIPTSEIISVGMVKDNETVIEYATAIIQHSMTI